MKAILALSDGSYFEGEAFGAKRDSQGEVCFNTSMTGYQEILTDPSYTGQIVTLTYPEIGNYGVNNEDVESKKIQAAGFVVKNCCDQPSNWRRPDTTQTLSDYLKDQGIPGIQGIDTRRLVRILRDKGAMPGVLAQGDYRVEEVVARAKKVPSMAGQDLAKSATEGKQYEWESVSDGHHPIRYQELPQPGKGAHNTGLRIAVMDFGLKRNILRILKSMGASVLVVPAQASAKEILDLKPDGVLLSNGPGDPEPVDYAVVTIRELLGKVPVFGICLGHQLLSLALGAKTYKLKFGHRGANHPIKYLKDGTVAITSQNHGFAVDADSLDSKMVEITHLNLNDGTVAGIRHKNLPAFSVQYHPEASPGPKDAEPLFADFFRDIHQFKKSASS